MGIRMLHYKGGSRKGGGRGFDSIKKGVSHALFQWRKFDPKGNEVPLKSLLHPILPGSATCVPGLYPLRVNGYIYCPATGIFDISDVVIE